MASNFETAKKVDELKQGDISTLGAGDDQFGELVMSAATPERIMQVGLGFWASKTLLL